MAMDGMPNAFYFKNVNEFTSSFSKLIYVYVYIYIYIYISTTECNVHFMILFPILYFLLYTSKYTILSYTITFYDIIDEFTSFSPKVM